MRETRLIIITDLHPLTSVPLSHRQLEAQAEEQVAETQKEKKLRERNEQYSRQLEEELEGLKVSLQKTVLTRSCLLFSHKPAWFSAEAGWPVWRDGLGRPDAGGGPPARRLGEEDAAVRGGAGPAGDAAQRRAQGLA